MRSVKPVGLAGLARPAGLSRRHLLRAGAALALWPAADGRAHGQLGPVTPPQPLPVLDVTLHDGRRLPLARLLQGRLTALQLMFTGCSSLCPVQGAVFAELQSRLASASGRVRSGPAPQLLSLSIDPLGDDARALAAWRARFGAGPDWLAVVPGMTEVEGVLAALRGREGGPDRHSTQVFVLDAQGRLVFRCAELASAEALAHVMRHWPG